MSRLVGYARVSTDDQSTNAQLDALKAAGCSVIFKEHRSGADRDRPELARAIAAAGKGDVLVVVRLDRLARSVRHLLEVIDTLRAKGAAFRSLGDPVDTSTPQGVFTIQILGAVAELERQLIASRTKAGIAAAVARGSRPGNPGLRARDARAITKIARARREGHTGRVIATVDAWLPTVRRMRPKSSWGEIVKELNKDPTRTGGPWNIERLKRSVRRIVDEHIAGKELLGRAPRKQSNPGLFQTVLAIRLTKPDMTLRQIAAQLEALQVKSPRGRAKWSASMVASILRTTPADTNIRRCHD